MNKQWYVIYTRSNCEKKVATMLTKLNIENYCPLNRTIRQWADRKKMIFAPLFPSYVFVRIGISEFIKVRQSSSDIINFVYWLGKPAIVRNEEVEQVMLFLELHLDVKLEKNSIHVNDKIRVISGPLENMEGNVKAIEHNKVKLLLPSLGYIMIAETTIHNVQVVQDGFQVNRMVS